MGGTAVSTRSRGRGGVRARRALVVGVVVMALAGPQ
jgi:hypothetical protein